MSHEVNEQIKERCYTQAENEVYALKKKWSDDPENFWHTYRVRPSEFFDSEKEYWQELTDAKAMVLYNNWRSND